MFGYLQVQKSELLVREFEAYKAVYCGLCKQMGKDYSFVSRLTLSYDCTFYAMLLMSINRSCSGFKDGRCTFNPLKKCKFATSEGNAYHKAAAFSVISVYYKLKDDISDSRFLKRTLCRLLKPLFSHWRKKALKSYSEIDKLADEMMKMQYEIEHSDETSLDRAAHPTAFMIASLFSLDAKDEMQKRVFYEFGYHMGRWIYLVDAADDIEKDKKYGNYNPFVNIKNGETKSPDYITSVLNQSLARAYDAYNLIDVIDFKGILDNMITLGFPAVQNRVVKKLCNESDLEVNNERSI